MATIDVPVYDMAGKQLGTEQIDDALLGGRVRMQLLKQAVVAYEAAQRQGTFSSKTRAEVEGSSRKLYRQKGTGNARMGNVRTPVRRGGGHSFAKKPRDFDRKLPRRMRQMARDSAILAKLKAGRAMIIDSMNFGPQRLTNQFAKMLKAVGVKGTCLVTLADRDATIWRAGRNIPGIEILPLSEVNAYHVLRPRQVVFTRDAFERIRKAPATAAMA